MNSNHRESIPFFNDLPTPAIHAAARLWDYARKPGYNGAAAYRDFTIELNDVKVAPPAQALVKRWVAGVQANLIKRPGGDAIPAQANAHDASQGNDFAGLPGYFENFPERAAVVLQSAWDRASAPGFDSQFMYNAFSRDVLSYGYEAPSRADFDAWIKGVERKEIERPARHVGDGFTTPVTDREALRVAVSSIVDAPFIPLTPDAFKPSAITAATPLVLLTGKSPLGDLVAAAVEEKAAALQAQAHDYARKIIAEQLREIAAELEAAA